LYEWSQCRGGPRMRVTGKGYGCKSRVRG
jgi:hypothetical protein